MTSANNKLADATSTMVDGLGVTRAQYAEQEPINSETLYAVGGALPDTQTSTTESLPGSTLDLR